MQIEPDPSWKIPDRLNILLSLSVSFFALMMLWLGNRHIDQPAILLLLGILYSYLMLTNYSLMHEAAHDKLHSNSKVNYRLGMFISFFFPMSITLLRNTHTKHHTQNRSEKELFDAYSEDDSRTKKIIQWYAILLGFFWFYPVIGSIVLALFPPEKVQQWFLNDKPGRAYAANFSTAEIRHMRLELLIFIGFLTLIMYTLNIHPLVLAVFYTCFAINWSTRQFIEHAYTRLHLTEGALNLKHFPWMSSLLLHRELDLNHHRFPDVPWNYLPKLLAKNEPQIPYWKQYLRLWKGPIPLSELKQMQSNADH